jgi:hypothetical protein
LKNFEDKYDPEEYLKVVEETSSIIEELCSIWKLFF